MHHVGLYSDAVPEQAHRHRTQLPMMQQRAFVPGGIARRPAGKAKLAAAAEKHKAQKVQPTALVIVSNVIVLLAMHMYRIRSARWQTQ